MSGTHTADPGTPARPRVGLVWAQSADGWIGRNGTLPWHLPEDLARFRRVTSGAAVVMGRRTWDSLPERFRPLPERRNVVLTRDASLRLPGADVVTDPAAALAGVADERVWVIGGAAVFAAFEARADLAEVTDVDVRVEGDTPAPALGAGWVEAAREPGTGWATSGSGLRYRFRTLVRGTDADGAGR